MFKALLTSLLLAFSLIAHAADDTNPVVVMETNKGTVVIELWQDRAPVSVENFLKYVDNNLYNNLIFHRVIPGFMIQGGGYTSSFTEMSGYPPIKNEASPTLKNDRGTLAMARTNVVDSATSQFFINLVDNEFLNQTGTTAQNFGYAVFGQVIEGMDVVDAIAGVATANQRQHQNVPIDPIIIQSMTRR
ncbi:MAG: peptidylprolyl isomerase [Pseudohongiella sp.]|nr:peptidylprolyl isomerase [Pseudohongiella sp.]MDO9519590.1 peptidylprolyl isomerase [Pseudohongiella sp.]MDP2127402.1 peptidylprolyl isomerase [Pseudohongiella sp.]